MNNIRWGKTYFKSYFLGKNHKTKVLNAIKTLKYSKNEKKT